MAASSAYSTYFHCIYDQASEEGRMGRGAHYSVFRAIERLDVDMKPSIVPQVHNFAVVWDEDHDRRVITAAESLYMNDLLAPVQFVGERKGTLTLVLAARALTYMDMSEREYSAKVEKVLQSSGIEDYWPVVIGSYDRSRQSPHQRRPEYLIAENSDVVLSYLDTIDHMWDLGSRPWEAPGDAPTLGWVKPSVVDR